MACAVAAAALPADAAAAAKHRDMPHLLKWSSIHLLRGPKSKGYGSEVFKMGALMELPLLVNHPYRAGITYLTMNTH